MDRRTFKLQFVQADCGNCRRVFSIPFLGDFNYGNFVFYGQRGTVFVFVSAFEEPWEEIESVLADKIGSKSNPNYKNIARFQRVVAMCADESNGQKFGLTPVCPSCGSHRINYGDSKPLKVEEVPFATFVNFMSKPKPERHRTVVDLWNADASLGDLE